MSKVQPLPAVEGLVNAIYELIWSMVAVPDCIKCVTQEGSTLFTSDAERLLTSLDIEHPAAHLVMAAVTSHKAEHLTGTKTLVFTLTRLAKALVQLQQLAVPYHTSLDIIHAAFTQLTEQVEEIKLSTTDTALYLAKDGAVTSLSSHEDIAKVTTQLSLTRDWNQNSSESDKGQNCTTQHSLNISKQVPSCQRTDTDVTATQGRELSESVEADPVYLRLFNLCEANEVEDDTDWFFNPSSSASCADPPDIHLDGESDNIRQTSGKVVTSAFSTDTNSPPHMFSKDTLSESADLSVTSTQCQGNGQMSTNTVWYQIPDNLSQSNEKPLAPEARITSARDGDQYDSDFEDCFDDIDNRKHFTLVVEPIPPMDVVPHNGQPTFMDQLRDRMDKSYSQSTRNALLHNVQKFCRSDLDFDEVPVSSFKQKISTTDLDDEFNACFDDEHQTEDVKQSKSGVSYLDSLTSLSSYDMVVTSSENYRHSKTSFRTDVQDVCRPSGWQEATENCQESAHCKKLADDKIGVKDMRKDAKVSKYKQTKSEVTTLTSLLKCLGANKPVKNISASSRHFQTLNDQNSILNLTAKCESLHTHEHLTEDTQILMHKKRSGNDKSVKFCLKPVKTSEIVDGNSFIQNTHGTSTETPEAHTEDIYNLCDSYNADKNKTETFVLAQMSPPQNISENSLEDENKLLDKLILQEKTPCPVGILEKQTTSGHHHVEQESRFPDVSKTSRPSSTYALPYQTNLTVHQTSVNSHPPGLLSDHTHVTKQETEFTPHETDLTSHQTDLSPYQKDLASYQTDMNEADVFSGCNVNETSEFSLLSEKSNDSQSETGQRNIIVEGDKCILLEKLMKEKKANFSLQLSKTFMHHSRHFSPPLTFGPGLKSSEKDHISTNHESSIKQTNGNQWRHGENLVTTTSHQTVPAVSNIHTLTDRSAVQTEEEVCIQDHQMFNSELSLQESPAKHVKTTPSVSATLPDFPLDCSIEWSSETDMYKMKDTQPSLCHVTRPRELHQARSGISLCVNHLSEHHQCLHGCYDNMMDVAKEVFLEQTRGNPQQRFNLHLVDCISLVVSSSSPSTTTATPLSAPFVHLVPGLVISCNVDFLEMLNKCGDTCTLSALLINGELSPTFHHKGYKPTLSKRRFIRKNLDGNQEQDVTAWSGQALSVIKKLNVKLLVVKGQVCPMLSDMCAEAGVLVLSNVRYHTLCVLSCQYNVDIITYLPQATQIHICSLRVASVTSDWMNLLQDEEVTHKCLVSICAPTVQTVVLHSWCEMSATLREEKFWNHLHGLVNKQTDGQLLPGGGLTELWCAHKIQHIAQQSLVNGCELEFVVLDALAGVFQDFYHTVQHNTGHLQAEESPYCGIFSRCKDHFQTTCDHSRDSKPADVDHLCNSSTRSMKLLSQDANDTDLPETTSHVSRNLKSGQDYQRNSLDVSPMKWQGLSTASAKSCMELISNCHIWDNYQSKISSWQTALDVVSVLLNLGSLVITGVDDIHSVMNQDIL